MEQEITSNVNRREVKQTPSISINPITLFVNASKAKKISIVKNQKNPPPIPTSYYASATAAMKRYIKNGFDVDVILDAINELQSKSIDPSKDKALAKRSNQINALRNFLEITFPETFKTIKCSFTTSRFKPCIISNVEVTVSPDIIIRRDDNGVKYIGAIKFDVHKDQLDFSIGQQRASLLNYYLEIIKGDDEIVDKNYCLCVDVMHDNIYRPNLDISKDIALISEACKEVVEIWKIV